MVSVLIRLHRLHNCLYRRRSIGSSLTVYGRSSGDSTVSQTKLWHFFHGSANDCVWDLWKSPFASGIALCCANSNLIFVPTKIENVFIQILRQAKRTTVTRNGSGWERDAVETNKKYGRIHVSIQSKKYKYWLVVFAQQENSIDGYSCVRSCRVTTVGDTNVS